MKISALMAMWMCAVFGLVCFGFAANGFIALPSMTSAEDRELIGTAIASLSPDHRIVVALRFYRDLTVPAIAARLGVPVGTVQSRLHHALKRLRDAIAPADAQGTDR